MIFPMEVQPVRNLGDKQEGAITESVVLVKQPQTGARKVRILAKDPGRKRKMSRCVL